MKIIESGLNGLVQQVVANHVEVLGKLEEVVMEETLTEYVSTS